MTQENTKPQDGEAVSSLSRSDLFGGDRTEIVIKLQTLAYPEDKERFEQYLMNRLKAMFKEADELFDKHKLIAARYDVELRHVTSSPNVEDRHSASE